MEKERICPFCRNLIALSEPIQSYHQTLQNWQAWFGWKSARFVPQTPAKTTFDCPNIGDFQRKPSIFHARKSKWKSLDCGCFTGLAAEMVGGNAALENSYRSFCFAAFLILKKMKNAAPTIIPIKNKAKVLKVESFLTSTLRSTSPS